MATCVADSLCADGSVGVLAADEIQALFSSDLCRSLSEIKQFAERRDHLRVASIAHRLQGQARTLEVSRLGEVAGQLEQAARSGDPSRIRGMVSEFHFACSQYDSVVASYCVL